MKPFIVLIRYLLRILGNATRYEGFGNNEDPLSYEKIFPNFLFWRYLLAYAVKTVNLPFLADSINEGTIAEFVKSNYEFKQRKEIGLIKIKQLPM